MLQSGNSASRTHTQLSRLHDADQRFWCRHVLLRRRPIAAGLRHIFICISRTTLSPGLLPAVLLTFGSPQTWQDGMLLARGPQPMVGTCQGLGTQTKAHCLLGSRNSSTAHRLYACPVHAFTLLPGTNRATT